MAGGAAASPEAHECLLLEEEADRLEGLRTPLADAVAAVLRFAYDWGDAADHEVERVDDHWECAEDCPACIRWDLAVALARATRKEL